MNSLHSTCKLLNSNEAKQLLQHMSPGSAVYEQIQRALLQSGIQEIPALSCKLYASEQSLPGGFGSSEHMAIAKEVCLQGIERSAVLQKGLTSVYFHHIVALAGDYYGVYGEAIAAGASEEEKKQRFLKAFGTLEEAENNQIRSLLLLMDQEFIQDEHASLPHHCYSSQLNSRASKLEKIKGDIGKLLIDNSDHFYKQAEEAYFIGHDLARQEAREARGDVAKLKRAYAIDAFACHFLTDLFASGHLRNQRLELENVLLQMGFDSETAKKLAGVVTGAQHEKDGAEGLNVKNDRGDYWRAYGDGCFRTPKNWRNREKVVEATQRSVNEIYEAFKSPDQQSKSNMHELLPIPTEENPFPLYEVVEGRLFIYEGTEKAEITGQIDFLDRVLGLALAHVPQQYQNEFLDGAISELCKNLPEVHWTVRAAHAQCSRLQATTWNLLGLSSHLEIENLKNEFNEKIEEMAEGIKETVERSREICENIEIIGKKVDAIKFDLSSEELFGKISKIQDQIYKFRKIEELDAGKLRTIEEIVYEAYIRIGRVCEKGTSRGVNLFEEYKKILISKSYSEKKARIAATLWLRQVLDYQELAFSLYCLAQVLSGKINREEANNKMHRFAQELNHQIDANRGIIQEQLIYSSTSYIETQLKKCALIEQSESKFNTLLPK